MTKWSRFLAIVGAAAVVAIFPVGPVRADAAADAAYLAYLGEFKSGAALAAAKKDGASPVGVGRRLRELYTRTSFYHPYSDASQKSVQEAMQHRREGRFVECLAAAEAALELNYTNLNAHYFASKCSDPLPDPERANRLTVPYVLLMEAIVSEPGHDGRTPDTSFWAINVAEQYVVLGHLGFKAARKSLVRDGKGEVNDCHYAVATEGGSAKMLCFNVAVPMAALSRELASPAPKAP